MSLVATIRARGGIRVRDDQGNVTREGGEIMAGLKDVKQPGLINNATGKPADTVREMLREMLRERGWFGVRDDEGADIQSLYDALGSGDYRHPEAAARPSRSETPDETVTDEKAAAEAVEADTVE
mgnify:CR=1 FL=1